MNKPNYSYIGITFILLVFGIIFIPKIINRIQHGDINRSESRSINLTLKPTSSSYLPFLILNGKKKKILPFKFTNQNDQVVTNEDFNGKVYLIDFFFTTCPTICPRMNKNLLEIEKSFSSRTDFGIASITINPNYDTVEILKKYTQNLGVTNSNWHFLTGDQELIYKFANEGFNLYAAKVDNAPGGFEHSGNFALIDKNGFIRSRLDKFGNPKIYYNGIISQSEVVDSEGAQEEISMLKEDIIKLLNE